MSHILYHLEDKSRHERNEKDVKIVSVELSRNVNYDAKRLEIVQHAQPLQSNEGEGKVIVT